MMVSYTVILYYKIAIPSLKFVYHPALKGITPAEANFNSTCDLSMAIELHLPEGRLAERAILATVKIFCMDFTPTLPRR